MDVWLRGGWALDLLLGRVTRPHVDVDCFAWAAGADRLAAALEARAFTRIDGPPPEQQRDLVRDGVKLQITLLVRTGADDIVTAGGRYDHLPWPEGMLADDVGRIDEVAARVIAPRAQLAIKETTPELLGRPVRDKDLRDVELLQAYLRAGGGTGGSEPDAVDSASATTGA